MVFQGTPPRHREKQWRNRYYGCSIAHSNFCIGSGSTAKGKFLPDNLTYYTNLIPAHPELFGKYYRDRHYTHGQDFCIYTFPPHLSRMDRIYDTCFPTWATTPGIRWEAKDEFSGERFFNEPVCSCTLACDRIVAQAHDILADNPYVHGIYFDISHVVSCNNALHGHGGTDAFGKKFATSEALDMRHFFLRIYKLHRKYPEKYMMLHAHNKFYPFVHDFADVWCPGEELFESYCEKPYWYYMEEVSPEAYQSAWNGKIRGVAIQMIPQEERALALMESMKIHKDWIPTEATVIRRLSACMLHDINCWENFWCLKKKHPLGILRGINRTLTMEDATFHGYWMNNVVTTENPATKVSWYSWDSFAFCKRVLVIVNTTRTPTTPRLKINWEAFGMDSQKASFHDLWNDQPTTLDEIQSTTIPPNYFLYIGVR